MMNERLLDTPLNYTKWWEELKKTVGCEFIEVSLQIFISWGIYSTIYG